MKIIFLILLFSISYSTTAGDHLEGISGSIGKRIFYNKNEPEKWQSEEITKDTQLQAESISAPINESKSQPNINDDSMSLVAQHKQKHQESVAEIDILLDINTQFEELFNNLELANTSTKSAREIPTQIFKKIDTELAKINSLPIQTANNVSILTEQTCAKEKVYILKCRELSSI